MSSELPPDAPIPRLCHLVKWVDFDGYGFNLHAEKSRTGQFIGKVDDDSPAQHAGLQEGDRIIEVNGVNIANENHRQVVERIKSVANETKLLVVDEAADQWYKERKVVVKSTLPNVRLVKTPVPRPYKEPPCYENVAPNGDAKHSPELPVKHENGQNQNGYSAPPVTSNGTTTEKTSVRPPSPSIKRESVRPPSPTIKEESVRPPSPSIKAKIIPESPSNGITPEKKIESVRPSSPSIKAKITDSPIAHKTKEEVHNSRSSTPLDGHASIPDSPHSSRSTNSIGGGSNGPASVPSLEEGVLNLNMSASEMRQMLANRRKKDPKKEQMDIRQKYEIIQQM
ncbi:hypothetical protein JTE90_010801 [Oedothorax gibbosus]|uniref:PDZ domain-containing protein n=1 Tax=Oedothorax gibbosus TaxID=931172 RepID=A0AAV6VIH0_9ARAC|nr:hypothetical protein JTE90_010801 [Oedothorax gibbosus]